VSIFSRLFKGPEDGDKESTPEGAPPGPTGERARKPTADANVGTDAKGSMRPMAPSFQINPPVSDRSGQVAITASPVVQVGSPDSRPRVASAHVPPQSPAAGLPTTQPLSVDPLADARVKNVGTATVKLGSAALAQQAPGSSNQASSGAQRPAPPPMPTAAGRPSPPAAPVRGAPSRTRAVPGATNREVVKGSAVATRVHTPAVDDSGVDGLLTLELGTSPAKSPGAARSKRGPTTTAQGLAPAAKAAEDAAARASFDPHVTTAVDHEGNLQTDLDAAFGAMVDAPNGVSQRRGTSASASQFDGAVSEMRDLFASLAANHMRQVREFMIGVKWGEAPRDWIPICEPAVASLLRAAKEMELADLCGALGSYRDALIGAADASTTTIDQGTRDGLMAAYAKLAELMPQAFGLEGERGRRETIIVHALLQQVPEVRKVTIDKIYAAGLTNLDHLFVARPDELSATTGIGENLASRIVEKFQRYRREIASLADTTRAAERQRLAELATELRGLHRDFERAAEGWSDDERVAKKKFRQSRAEALLQVKVLLARLGEVDRLGTIERLPFERKIEQLEAYLREAKEASVP
jgi:hypothetical protein